MSSDPPKDGRHLKITNIITRIENILGDDDEEKIILITKVKKEKNRK